MTATALVAFPPTPAPTRPAAPARGVSRFAGAAATAAPCVSALAEGAASTSWSTVRTVARAAMPARGPTDASSASACAATTRSPVPATVSAWTSAGTRGTAVVAGAHAQRTSPATTCDAGAPPTSYPAGEAAPGASIAICVAVALDCLRAAGAALRAPPALTPAPGKPGATSRPPRYPVAKISRALSAVTARERLFGRPSPYGARRG